MTRPQKPLPRFEVPAKAKITRWTPKCPIPACVRARGMVASSGSIRRLGRRHTLEAVSARIINSRPNTSINEPSKIWLEMRVIKVCPVAWFRGAWKTLQGTGVERIFPWPNGKQKAIDHARGLFGDASGEIHVYADDGATVIETIQIDAGTSTSEQGHFSAHPDSIPRLTTDDT